MTKEVLGTRERKKEQGTYSKPQLIEYGKVEEITQGGGSAAKDFGGQPKLQG